VATIAGVLLAAGKGARFGADSKLMANLGGRPVVDWAAAAMQAAGIAPRVAVIRPGDDAVRGVVEARGFEVVENPRSEEGMGTSIAAGAVWAKGQGVDGVLIALGDMPFVTLAHLGTIVGMYAKVRKRTEGCIVASAEGTRFTVPAIFPDFLIDALASLDGDQGARALFGGQAVAGAQCEARVLDDVDTPEALAAARGRLDD
jgi:CTP:molybdopterin cytidylyltransferase MocA